MLYTAWGRDGEANVLVAGAGPPAFADGTPDPDAPELVWALEAGSWDEAVRRYHALQGWGPPRAGSGP